MCVDGAEVVRPHWPGGVSSFVGGPTGLIDLEVTFPIRADGATSLPVMLAIREGSGIELEEIAQQLFRQEREV